MKTPGVERHRAFFIWVVQDIQVPWACSGLRGLPGGVCRVVCAGRLARTFGGAHRDTGAVLRMRGCLSYRRAATAVRRH